MPKRALSTSAAKRENCSEPPHLESSELPPQRRPTLLRHQRLVQRSPRNDRFLGVERNLRESSLQSEYSDEKRTDSSVNANKGG